MKKLLRIGMRVAFGTDMTIGMAAFALFYPLMSGASSSLAAFALALASSHLPDLDMLPYLLAKDRLRYRSHWLIGHHPFIVMPLAAAFGYLASGSSPWDALCLAAMTAACVIAHFVHDSLQPQGLHWLSPLSWKRYTLEDGCLKAASREATVQFLLKARRRGSLASAKEISSRIPPIDARHIVCWMIAAALDIACIITH